ncbi:MAG: hypothetical protein H6Q14_1932 [Bacteroidetes bacterium]|jgi:hypothetical protein|nr:hypothetical protein [Bacteroidota bacterium]
MLHIYFYSFHKHKKVAYSTKQAGKYLIRISKYKTNRALEFNAD